MSGARTWMALEEQARQRGFDGIPLNPASLPIKEIALAIAERADELGLVWRLVPATVAAPGAGGVMRVVLDGDSQAIDAVTMIGRLPVGGRVFVVLSPPAGVHIVGFLGYDFPPSVSGEAVGRPRLITLNTAFNASSSTFDDVTDMRFTASPNAGYLVKARLSMNAQTADDVNVAWSVPSGAAMTRYYIALPNAETTATGTSMINGRVDSATLGLQSAGVPATTVNPGFWEDTYLRTGATGGVVQLRFARAAAVGSTVTMRANSYLEVQRYR